MANGINLGSIFVTVGAKTKDFHSKLEKAQAKVTSVGSSMQSMGSKMSLGLTLPLLGVGKVMFQTAASFEEASNRVSVVFADSADTVRAFAKTTIDSFGIAEGTALGMAGLFGDLGTSMGISREAAAGMATTLTGLAGDLSSYKDVSIEVAQNALKGIFTGETDAMTNLGYAFTQSAIEAWALSKGLAASFKDLTEAEKVQLRYAYILDVSSDAQGDFARTSESASNVTRTAGEEIKQLSKELGDELIPVITPVIAGLRDLVKWFGGLEPNTKKVILASAGFLAVLGPLLTVIGTAITAWPVLTAVVGGIGTAVSWVAGVFPLLGTAIGVLSGPIGWIVLALVGIGTALVVLYKKNENFRILVQKTWKVIQNVFKGIFKTIKNVFVATWKVIVEKTVLAWSAIGKVFSITLGAISSAIKIALNWIYDKVTTIMNALGINWESALTGMKNVGARILDAITTFFYDSFSWIVDKFKAVMQFLNIEWDEGLDEIEARAKKTPPKLEKTMGEGGKKAGKALTDGLDARDRFAQLESDAEEGGEGIVGGITEGLGEGSQNLDATLDEILNGLKDTIVEGEEEAGDAGADAARKAAEKVAKQKERDAKKAAKEQEKENKRAAKEAKRAVEEQEKIAREGSIAFGNAVVDALKYKYSEAERIEVDALNKSVDHLRNTTNRKIALWNSQLKARLKTLDAETDASILQKQKEIDELNDRTDDEEKLLKEAQYQKDLQSKKEEWRLAKDGNKRFRIQEQIAEMEAKHEREKILEAREIQIEGLREEIDQIKDQAAQKAELMNTEYENKVLNIEKETEAKERFLKREIENTKNHYAKLLESESLQAEARLLIMTGNNDEIIDLLTSYNSDWYDAGKTFGEKLVEGIKSQQSAIQQAVQDALALLRGLWGVSSASFAASGGSKAPSRSGATSRSSSRTDARSRPSSRTGATSSSSSSGGATSNSPSRSGASSRSPSRTVASPKSFADTDVSTRPIAGPKSFADTVLPQFAKGTNYVPRDMIAMIHEGEAIIPKEYNADGSPSSNSVVINITGNTISRQMDVNRIGEDMVRKLRTAGVSF